MDIRVYLRLRKSGRHFSIRYFSKGASSGFSGNNAFPAHRAGEKKETLLRFFTHKRSSIVPGIIRMLTAARRLAAECLNRPLRLLMEGDEFTARPGSISCNLATTSPCVSGNNKS